MRASRQITSAAKKESDEMGRFAVEVTVTNNEDHALAKAEVISMDQVRRARLMGVVDSGAAHLVLPGKIVKQLGLPDAGKVKVRYADHRIGKRQRVSNVLLELLGRDSTVREERQYHQSCCRFVMHHRSPLCTDVLSSGRLHRMADRQPALGSLFSGRPSM